MSLLRFAARTLLASYFVVNGLKAVRHPGDFSDTAQPVVDKVIPPLTAALPDELAGYIPTDATGVARTCGVLQILGGIGLATGAGRRVSAAVLATTMLPQLAASNPIKAAADERAKFGAEIAVLGGVVLAALDTEGEPDLGWRLRAHRRLVAEQKAHRKAESSRAAHAITAGAAKGVLAVRKQMESARS